MSDRRLNLYRCARLAALVLALLSPATATLSAQEAAAENVAPAQAGKTANNLSPDQWSRLDRAVDAGLEFLSTQQLPDGSFNSDRLAQPAVTSFCVMAFLSRGHMPDHGPYGRQISRAIRYVLSTQQPSGLFYAETAGTENWKLRASYNHAIAGVMLGEVYGMAGAGQQETIRVAVEKAMAEHQSPNGSWDLEANQDGVLGYTYSTSLAILSLTPPYQLLPIYQR